MGPICNGYICIVLYIYVTYLVYWFSRDLFPIGGGGVNLPWVYVQCAISAKCGVVLFKASMLNWRRRAGVNLPWVYVHSARYETYLV